MHATSLTCPQTAQGGVQGRRGSPCPSPGRGLGRPCPEHLSEGVGLKHSGPGFGAGLRRRLGCTQPTPSAWAQVPAPASCCRACWEEAHADLGSWVPATMRKTCLGIPVPGFSLALGFPETHQPWAHPPTCCSEMHHGPPCHALCWAWGWCRPGRHTACSCPPCTHAGPVVCSIRTAWAGARLTLGAPQPAGLWGRKGPA